MREQFQPLGKGNAIEPLENTQHTWPQFGRTAPRASLQIIITDFYQIFQRKPLYFYDSVNNERHSGVHVHHSL